jgi:hypothetical protein
VGGDASAASGPAAGPLVLRWPDTANRPAIRPEARIEPPAPTRPPDTPAPANPMERPAEPLAERPPAPPVAGLPATARSRAGADARRPPPAAPERRPTGEAPALARDAADPDVDLVAALMAHVARPASAQGTASPWVAPTARAAAAPRPLTTQLQHCRSRHARDAQAAKACRRRACEAAGAQAQAACGKPAPRPGAMPATTVRSAPAAAGAA